MADEENGRSWGEFWSGLGETTVDALTGPIPIAGPIIRYALNTPRYQDEQAIREARRQKLANDMELSNIAVDQAKQTLINSRLDGENTSLRNQGLQFENDHREETYTEKIKLLAAQRRKAEGDADASETQAKLAQASFDANLRSANAVADQKVTAAQSAKEALANAQYASDNAFSVQKAEQFQQGMDSLFGVSGWDMFSQEKFRQSPEFGTARDAYVILSAFKDHGDEVGMRVASRYGYKTGVGENGERYLVSPAGQKIDYSNAQSVMDKMSERLRDSAEAYSALGTDATTLSQFVVKNIVGDSSSLFGGDPGTALGAYKKLLNSTNPDGSPRYSNIDRAGHLLSVSLTAALDDKKITPQEMAVLAPQFETSSKQIGVTLIPNGEDPTLSEVQFPNGQRIRLYDENPQNPSFASGLQQHDRIMRDWNALKNQVKSAQEMEMLKRTQKALEIEQAKKKLIGGGSDGGEDGEKDNAADQKLYEMYGDKYNALGDTQKKGLRNARKTLMMSTARMKQEEGVKSTGELSEAALLKLKSEWEKLVGDADLSADNYDFPDEPLLLMKQYERHQNALTKFREERDKLLSEANKKYPDFIKQVKEVEEAAATVYSLSSGASPFSFGVSYETYFKNQAGLKGEDFKKYYLEFDALQEKIKVSEKAIADRKKWLKKYGYDVE